MSTENELSTKIERCPAALQDTIEEFRSVTPRERLELLLEYADDLPELPAHIESNRDELEQVHECQTPVFLHTDVADNRAHFFFDIPVESPTVRGYAAILQEGFDGASPDDVLSAPDDIYTLLGLNEAISPLRLRGLHALMVTMKRQVRRQP